MSAAESFLIQNENDFNEFLASMLQRRDLDSDEFDFPEVVFDGWPEININVKGDPERYSSSLTASMLFGMAELTNEIQRAFTVISHDTHNRQKLKNSEKNLLDIVYHISEGSSQADGKPDAIINGAVAVLKEAIGKMTGRQALGAVLAIVLAAGTFGTNWVNKYYETQQHEATARVELVKTSTDAVNQAQRNAMEFLVNGQTNISREVLAHGEDGKNKFLKNISQDPSVSTVKLGDETISRDKLNAFNQRQSIDRHKQTRQDTFYVKGVTRTGPTNQDISIAVTRASNGESFIIKTSSEITSTEELKEFTDAVAQEDSLTISYLEVTENNHVTAGQLISIIHAE